MSEQKNQDQKKRKRMDAKQLVTIVIIGLVAIGIVYFIFSPQPEKYDIKQNATAVNEGWKTYSNATFGFSIEVPPGFTVDESYLNQALGPGREVPGVAIRVPDSMSQGTNLSSDSYLAIEEQSDVDCVPSNFINTTADGISSRIGQADYLYASTTGAAAGNRYDETVYVRQAGNRCFGLHYFIHYGAIGNYDPGTVKEFNETDLVKTFDQISSTFTPHP